jgi:hypothetical protein
MNPMVNPDKLTLSNKLRGAVYVDYFGNEIVTIAN